MRRLNQALYIVCVSNYFLIAWQGQCNPRISKKLQARADYSSFCDSMDNRRDANPVSSIIHGDREPPQRFWRFLYEWRERSSRGNMKTFLAGKSGHKSDVGQATKAKQIWQKSVIFDLSFALLLHSIVGCGFTTDKLPVLTSFGLPVVVLALLVAAQKNTSQMASFSYSKYLLFGLPVVVLAGLAALWWERNERKRFYKEVGRVSDLFIYPVKSCKGIRVNDVKCFKEGMEYDR